MSRLRETALVTSGVALAVALSAREARTAADEQVAPGSGKSATTKALVAGAKALQDTAPVEQLDVHLVGFHPLRDDPAHQMTAHHYCQQVNQDFAQCVLYDGPSASARLNGIEYIISEKLFETLPSDERRFWHPHNYEILSGQLVAPGVPGPAEHRLMAEKMNSYGKTWHVWMTGTPHDAGDALPFGPPHLAWSFNADGEAQSALVERRDRDLGVDTAALRAQRQDLVSQARPQCGVDALAARFPGARTPIRGVEARRDGCPSDGQAPGR